MLLTLGGRSFTDHLPKQIRNDVETEQDVVQVAGVHTKRLRSRQNGSLNGQEVSSTSQNAFTCACVGQSKGVASTSTGRQSRFVFIWT